MKGRFFLACYLQGWVDLVFWTNTDNSTLQDMTASEPRVRMKEPLEKLFKKICLCM